MPVRLTLALGALAALASPLPAQAPTLVLVGARVWTGDSTRPWAEAVAITGSTISAVGSRPEVERLAGPDTRVVRLRGGLVAPGFIDNHTHFNAAGALLLGVNLLDVSDGPGQAGTPAAAPFRPTRDLIDSITPATPSLLSRWDRSEFLANGVALSRAGAGCDWRGVECEGGRATGRLTAAAAERVRAAIPARSLAQRLAEAGLALAELRGLGVTTIHDVIPPEQLEVYQELERRGELTVRVYARPTLDRIEALRAIGLKPGFGNEWIRIGGLKGFVDGIMGNSSARFYEPYLTSGKLGDWRPMMEPPGNMERLLFLADSSGFWPQVHAIGDHAIDTLLTLFERVMTTNGPRPRRYRLIHAQVIRGPETARRMARLGVIAEVQPYHAIDDMRWMEQRIGARARWAYAFRTLRDAGVLLSFGSDWPGTNASWYTANPLIGIYAAVNRQTLAGEPAAGWFPEERIDLETALRAYTVNNAWAAGEEQVKGTLRPGRLADLVVLDRDPFTIPLAQLKDIRVLQTIVGGRTVYRR
jgi:hypothetical protein